MTILAAWHTVLGPHPSTSTHTATTTFVTATSGSAYVLKRVTGLDDLGERSSRLVAEYRTLLHLRASAVPIALPLVADDGRIFASLADDAAIYTLTPRLPADDSESPLGPIGASLGRLHRALRTSPFEVPSWTIDLVPRTFDGAVRDITSHLDAPIADELLAALEQRRPLLLDALTDLPTQRIHGDFHRGNVLVHEGEVSGIIDLDHLPIGPRIYDLAYFLANQLALPTAAELVDRTEQLLLAWRELVDGYQSINELTTKELTSLAPLTFAVQLQLIGWNLAQPGYEWSQDHIHGFHWIDKHLRELGGEA